jgi:hypothetical protein
MVIWITAVSGCPGNRPIWDFHIPAHVPNYARTPLDSLRRIKLKVDDLKDDDFQFRIDADPSFVKGPNSAGPYEIRPDPPTLKQDRSGIGRGV